MSLLPLLLLLVFFSTTNIVASTINPHLSNFTDHQALIAFKHHITSDPRNVLANWNDSTSFCNWNGVICSQRRQRVTSLSLRGMDLTGLIAPQIGNLSFLVLLDLGNNSFHGNLPSEIGHLRRLRVFILNFNQLQGRIPGSLGHCQELRHIRFVTNKFDGKIPHEIGLLPHLLTLFLSENSLTGAIPPSIGNLSSLITLQLTENHLQGIIPPELGNLQSLQIMSISGNNLDGMVPPSLFNSSSPISIDLGLNKLQGYLPILAVPNLDTLVLNGNQLSGPIPSSLFNSSKLTVVFLSYNNFTGPVPLSWGDLPVLEELSLESNQLVNGQKTSEMRFLTSLNSCRFLTTLGLSFNPLGGILPSSIGNLSVHLEKFLMPSNQIKGSIPPGIGNLTSLIYLAFYDNALDGKIPSDIGRLQELQLLDFSGNGLQGSIPNAFGSLKNLGYLSLYQNRLSGQIPGFLKNLTRLEELYLNDNRLLGKIPSGVWSSTTMRSVDFSGNYLSDLLPQELGSLDHLDSFFASRNQLSGEIPKSLGKLMMLRRLDLSDNSFMGSIPLSFSNFISMETMDISKNNLSGTIPKSLALLQHLKSLNLSFNKLEGEIPTGGVFKNLTFKSFMGNPELCGSPKFQLPACPKNQTTSTRKKRGSRLIIIVPTVIIMVLGLSLIFLFSWVLHQRKKLKAEESTDSISLTGNHRRISYHEILIATDNFNEVNLLGFGSFGSVYKGNLSDGTVTAIKVLNLQNDRASKSFDIECKVLSSIRHRNLVKIITVCSNLDFKALVFQFMNNGSLDNWLYPNNGGECELNLLQRLNIMIDVASAMEYLHHGYSNPIIHCDLKPSNVLLDQDMVAHVGDFGISRLLMENHSITPTSMVGSIGYIAPEYAQAGRISAWGDVYSYGILLLEMFTRRKPTDSMFTGDLSLSKWIHAALPQAIMEIVDENLWREYDHTYHKQRKEGEQNGISDHLASILKLGLLCASESIEERIDMRESLARLKNIRKEIVGGF